MLTEHHPWDDQSYSLGVNSALDNELLGKGNTDKGEYLAARNMRPNNADGSFGILKTIGGEVNVFPSIDNSCVANGGYYASNNQDFSRGKWVAVAATYVLVSGDPIAVEWWADEGGNCDPFLRVNGKIVCASSQLPFNYASEIQLDASDNQDGAEIFWTDNENPPVYMDVYDLLLNSGVNVGTNIGECTQKYFNEFDVTEYGIQLKNYGHHPVFTELTENTSYPDSIIYLPTVGDPGLTVGQHSYRIRYVDTEGNLSAFCIPTPLIPVVYNYEPNYTNSQHYPNNKIYGKVEGTQSPFGIVLKLRIENRLNYDYAQLTRVSYEDVMPIGFTPTEVIVGNIPLIPDEFSIKTLVDFGAEASQITQEDQVTPQRNIDAAKSIRYFSARLELGNVKYASSIIDDVFTSDAQVLSVLKNMGTEGHSDPYNCAYHRNTMSGERYGYAIIFMDSSLQRTFALDLPGASDFLNPDRRDTMSAESELYSYDNVPVGCNESNTPNTSVYEKFSLANAIQKTGGLENRTIHKTGYFVLTPKGQEDTITTGHRHQINNRVWVDGVTPFTYNPKIFAPEYFSLGIAIKGIDPTKIPSWATSFTIVRTSAAGRVKFQGMGFYDIDSPRNKSLDNLLFYSPETDSLNGIVNPDDIDFGLLKAQVVAPYGYTSEVYMGKARHSDGNASTDRKWVDICVYPRIIKENALTNVDGSSHGNGGCTAFGKWRNATIPSWANTAAKKYFNIDSFSQYSGDNIVSDISEYFKLNLASDVYQTASTDHSEYLQSDVMEFHEPLYLINVVNNEALVPQPNVKNFYDTGCYVKLRSCIGRYYKTTNSYPLIDERWEDCIPALNGIGYGNSVFFNRDAFVYVKTQLNTQKWWNVTNKTQLETQSAQNAIAANGSYLIPGTPHTIYGLYTHTNTNNRTFTIEFGYDNGFGGVFTPAEGDEIWVYYDPDMPVRVFGGEHYVGEAIYSPIFRAKNAVNEGGTMEFGVGLPYHKFQMNNIGIVGKAFNGDENPHYDSELEIQAIRQLVVPFIVESKVNLNFQYEIPSTQGEPGSASMFKFFPATHFIMRPQLWGVGNNFEGFGGAIPIGYQDDYPGEEFRWTYGGFRFRGKNNQDYYHSLNAQVSSSKPTVGYRDRTRYPTRVAYSLERVMNVQGAPNLRTFLPGNYYDLKDNTGEIKYLYDNLSERGNNLIVLTDHGITVLLIGKNILAQAEGTELATMIGTQGQFIGGEILINNEVGLPKDMWRSCTEGNNMLMFASLDSAYILQGTSLSDIGRNKFHNRLFGTYLKNITNGTHITGGYDPLHKEYWLQLDSHVLAYPILSEHWNDRYDYNFDRYISMPDNRTFGVGNRSSKTKWRVYTDEILLGEPTIGRETIINEVEQVSSPQQGYPAKAIPGIVAKEFIRTKIASNLKPTRVEFYEAHGGIKQCELSIEKSLQYLKDYTNFEQYIPRRDIEVDPDCKRLQGRQLVFKIIYEGAGFEIKQTSIQYKEIK